MRHYHSQFGKACDGITGLAVSRCSNAGDSVQLEPESRGLAAAGPQEKAVINVPLQSQSKQAAFLSSLSSSSIRIGVEGAKVTEAPD